MAPQEQTLQEMFDMWSERKREAEEALTHIRALMKIAAGTKRKLEATKFPKKGAKKPKYKPTGEDFILDILASHREPMTVAQIGEVLHKSGKQRSRQGINIALQGLQRAGRVVVTAAPPGFSAKKLYAPTAAKAAD